MNRHGAQQGNEHKEMEMDGQQLPSILIRANWVPRLLPRIVLSKCWQCNGAGRSLIRHRGRIVESTCTNCAGSGSVTSES